MKKLMLFLAIVAVTGVVATACGDDDIIIPIGGGGPGISVSEAIASDLEGPLLVNGNLFVINGQTELCELLLESLPPQCGGSSLAVEGLDLTTIEGLSSEEEVTWTNQTVQILGEVEGEILTVGGTVQ